ncbi:hypothetical protein CRM22_001628 [Opisthorchis felineus]|uniref:Aldehyde dehydrogenase domain-containing protein n=1 Tax=Opisthorchis felineus TaxID=147828 RepID=A0A4V3SGQ6_OPIFE|nr:hypothetical protein CRM22_001628 [Opisthorchis felineus]
MPKRFSAKLQLPRTIMENNFKDLKNFLAVHGSLVKPYYANTFNHLEDWETSEIFFGKNSVKIVESECQLKKTISMASEFSCNEGELLEFFERLRKILQIRSSQVQHAAASCGAVCQFSPIFFSKVLESVLETCKSNLEFPKEDSKPSSSPLHVVGSSACDILYHVTAILGMLSNPCHNGVSTGIVVVCYSQKLVLPLYVLSDIIAECSPPVNLYSFLPSTRTFDFRGPGYVIPIIFDSADVDSAARQCLELVKHHDICFWHSSVILVEESVEFKFVEKLRHTAVEVCGNDAPEEASQGQLRSKETLSYIEALKSKFGATVVTSQNQLPRFLYNVPPSALSSDLQWGIAPIGHIIKFRTAKEVCSIVKHFSNQVRYTQGELLNSHGHLSISINIWLNSPALCWQLADTVSSFGIQRIFINASSDRLVSALYKGIMDCNDFGSPYSLPGLIASTDDSKMALDLANLLSVSNRVQNSWSAQSFANIRRKVLGNFLGNDLFTSIARGAWESFVVTSTSLLNCDERFGLLGSEQTNEGGLIIARQWMKPCGPVAIFLRDNHSENSRFITFLFHTVLQAIFSGNSVILCLTEDAMQLENHCWFTEKFNTLVLGLPENLVMRCSFPALFKDNIPTVLKLLGHPAAVILPEPRWDAVTCCGTSEGHTRYCLVKRVTLFWSTGAEMFSN